MNEAPEPTPNVEFKTKKGFQGFLVDYKEYRFWYPVASINDSRMYGEDFSKPKWFKDVVSWDIGEETEEEASRPPREIKIMMEISLGNALEFHLDDELLDKNSQERNKLYKEAHQLCHPEKRNQEFYNRHREVE